MNVVIKTTPAVTASTREVIELWKMRTSFLYTCVCSIEYAKHEWLQKNENNPLSWTQLRSLKLFSLSQG